MSKLPIRRVALQSRSRKTVERVLASAAELVANKGVDPVTMTDIAAGADISLGTIYQYFADKSAIMQALLERHNEEVDALVRETITGILSLDVLIERLLDTYVSYSALHRDDPFYRNIWAAVSADAELQALDADDSRNKGGMLFDVAKTLYREVDEAQLHATCVLILHMALVVARFSMQLPPPLDQQMSLAFRGMIATSLRALEKSPGRS